jgi:hypothetical protein
MARLLSVRALLLVSGLVVACGGSGGADPEGTAGLRPVASSISLVADLRLAASSDGFAWVVWGEGDLTAGSIAAAAVDRSGNVARSLVSPATPGSQRDIQIRMSGAVPVTVWRSYPASGTEVRVHVAAYTVGRWTEESVVPASYGGAPQLIAHPDGSVSLLWQRVGPANSSELVFSKRSNAGQWSAPVVVAATPSGIDMGLAKHAAAPNGSMIAIWTEAPVDTNGVPQPQVLMASRYEPTAGAWAQSAAVDSLNGLYYQCDVAAAANGEWMAVWISGDPSRQPALLSSRWIGGAWANPTRIDEGSNYSIRELALAGDGQFIHLVWAGLAQTISPGSVRTSTFDSAQASWSPVTLLGRVDRGYPQRPRLASVAGGRAVAVWEVTQGDSSGPYSTERAVSGRWGVSRLLNPDGETGYVGDVALLSTGEATALWFRFGQQGLVDIFVRRWTLPE